MISGTFAGQNVQITYRNTPQSTTGFTSEKLLLVQKPKSQLDLLRPDMQIQVEMELTRQSEAHNAHEKRDVVYVKIFALKSPINLCMYIEFVYKSSYSSLYLSAALQTPGCQGDAYLCNYNNC